MEARSATAEQSSSFMSAVKASDAERVWREKISERMKVLQDLVPGCNKVTGQAVMLDEIINYVQSLQLLVEFLSMKLAAVTARVDSNTEAATLPEDVLQLSPPLHPHNSNNSIYPSDHSYYHFDTRSNLHSGILAGGSGTQAPFLPPTAAALAMARSYQNLQLPPVDNFTHTTPPASHGVASESSESGAQRSKSDEGERSKTCDDDDINPKQSSSKPPEPPKDYIHVRDRRGQATDAHSLAERVRREKISERMKVLQDLVPGCNKVTGKAVILDEIINYVQSLQRQVEFLSMKLAAVNPRMDSNTEAATLSKDVLQLSPPLHPHNSNNSIYPSDHSYYHFDTRSNLHSGILPGGSGTQAPFLPPTAAALAMARSNQSHKLPPPPVDNITHTTPASRVITPSSYQVMPNTCHDLNCSIEVGEAEENSGIWVDLNEEVTIPYGKNGRQRNRMSINITLEDLKPHFGKKLKDVVKEVGVSRSTIKRVCRESNIHRWPSHRNNKNNCAGFGTRMVNNRVQNSKKQMLNVCSSSESTSPNFPLNQNNLDDNASEVNKNFTETAEADVMVIKATFDNDTAKIQLYMSSSLEKLKEEVIKRFELEEGSFKLKYVDEDDQWILLACDDDLHLCMKTFKASGKTPVQVLVQPVGN